MTSRQPMSDSMIPQVLAIVRRHAWLAVVVFGVVLAGAVTVATSLPDIYRATATVLVEHPGTTEGTGKSLIAAELETRLQTIGQEVLSQARLLKLMESFDLYPELRANGEDTAAVERLRRDIQVKPVRVESAAGRPTTVAFAITLRSRVPRRPQARQTRWPRSTSKRTGRSVYDRPARRGSRV
jgi:polysaccharide biosynthesis transport protein